VITGLASLFLFPGLVFQVACGLFFEWLDRKLLALFQRRVGPPWYQPLADIIKLFSKEDLLPKGADDRAAVLLPIFSLSAVLTAGLYIPIAGFSPMSFEGDLIVILFLMSVPTLAYYLAGILSIGVYSVLGGGRSLLQFFSYEVPLLIVLNGPAVLSGSWSVSEIMRSQGALGPFILFQPLGLALALVGLIGKLKRAPLDIPSAKSEVVGGSLTEFSGATLALWRLTMNVQTVVSVFLLVNLYMGWTKLGGSTLVVGFIFVLECLALVVVLSAVSALFSRLRIDQLAGLGWRLLVPLSLLQLAAVILMRI
jgi:NADH-quinone oxidoreductase subunit H